MRWQIVNFNQWQKNLEKLFWELYNNLYAVKKKTFSLNIKFCYPIFKYIQTEEKCLQKGLCLLLLEEGQVYCGFKVILKSVWSTFHVSSFFEIIVFGFTENFQLSWNFMILWRGISVEWEIYTKNLFKKDGANEISSWNFVSNLFKTFWDPENIQFESHGQSRADIPAQILQ